MKPDGHSKTRTGALAVAGVCIGVAALYAAQDFLKPIALAVLLCFVLAPASQWLERRLRFPRVISVVLVSTLAGLFVVGVGWIVADQVTDLAKRLPEYQANIERKVGSARNLSNSLMERAMKATRDIKANLERVAPASPASSQPTTQSQSSDAHSPATANPSETATRPAEKVGVEILGRQTKVALPENGAPPPSSIPAQWSSAQPAASQPSATPVTVTNFPPIDSSQQSSFQTIMSFFGPLFSFLGNAAIVAVFVVFMLIQREDLRDRVIALVSSGRVGLTTEALDEAGSRVSRYLLMLCYVNGSYGVIVAVVLWFIGVPAAVLWGMLCALLRFVPYIGPWIAAAFPVTLSLAVGEDWSMPLWTISAFVVIELASNNVMEPLLYGRGTGVSPVAVIISAAFWTWLWGTSGLLMATPLTVCVAVAGRHVESLRFLYTLLGDEPALPRGVRYYQRLLAKDEHEALDVLRGGVAELGLANAFEQVAIVALKTAERDARRDWLSPTKFRDVLTGIRKQIKQVADEDIASSVVRDARGKPGPGTSVCEIPLKTQPLPANFPIAKDGGRRKTPRIWNRMMERRRRLERAASELFSFSPAVRDVAQTPIHKLPRDIHPRVLILPARDEPDELAGVMLGYILTSSGYDVTVASTNLLAKEMVDEVANRRPDLVIVSATPPAAVSHARYLLKKLASAKVIRAGELLGVLALPEVLTVLWSTGDKKRLAHRLSPDVPVNLATTLCATTECVRQLTAGAISSAATGALAVTVASSSPPPQENPA